MKDFLSSDILLVEDKLKEAELTIRTLRKQKFVDEVPGTWRDR
jgi:hypothetical protein